jgi:sec-independent protein translocase protein TatB
MFGQVGWGEILVLLVLGLFVFGPERLPKVAQDAGRMLRQLRRMATGVRDDIRAELGPEVADLDLRTLHPKAFVEKHLFSDDDDEVLDPRRDRYDLPGMSTGAAAYSLDKSSSATPPLSLDKPASPPSVPSARSAPTADAPYVAPYDSDAT